MLEGLIVVAFLILFAKLFEELATRFGQPPIVGWVLGGILLGPGVLGIAKATPEVLFLTSIGIYLFFFFIGFEEIEIEGVISSINRVYIAVAFLATTVHLLVTAAALIALGESSLTKALGLGVLATIPTASVVARVLSDMRALNTELGLAAFSYTLIGELISLLLVGSLLEAVKAGEITISGLALNFVTMLAYFALAGLASIFVVPKLIKATGVYMISKEALVGVLLATLLLFVGIAAYAGLHGVLGALILGLALSDSLTDERSREAVETIRKINEGVFIPIFFASMGLYFNWAFLGLNPMFLASLLLLFIPLKYGIHYALLRVFRISIAKELAVSMLARGSVDLAILGFFVAHGIVDENLYPLVIFIAVGSLVAYPFLAKTYVARAVPVKVQKLPLLPVITKYLLGFIRVRDIMEEPSPAKLGDSVYAAVKKMEELERDALVVVDDEGKVVGLVCKKHVVGLSRRKLESAKVREFVKEARILAKPESDLYTVLEEVSLLGQPTIPVVDDSGALVGEVTMRTVVKALVSKG